MKILQLGKFYPPIFGGIETVTQMLAKGLNEAGVACDVLCVNDGLQSTIEHHEGYRIIRAGSFGTALSVSVSPALVIWLWRLRHAYDVIHIHLPNPLAELAVFLVRPRARLVLHWHADVDERKFGWLKNVHAPLAAWLLRRAKAVVGATRSHIENSDFREYMSGKYKVIPYPFSVSDRAGIGCLDQDEMDRLTGRFVVFSVGRLIYYKGFKYLVAAARFLPPECIVVIAGSGPLFGELERQIKDMGLSDRVILLGSVRSSKLLAYYQRCDVFCFPSIYRGEMFGMVQVEAMSFGKPVIGTRIPKSGVHEVNLDGVTGVSVPVMDAQAIADAVVDLMGNVSLRNRLGDAGRLRVRDVYDETVVIPQFARLFDELTKS